MWPALLFLVLCGAATAQTLVAPGQISRITSRFDTTGRQPLRCEALQGYANLNYALRYQSGYTFRVSSAQYQGSSHTWYVLTKVTPEGKEPVLLYARHEPSDVTRYRTDFEINGGFYVGQGSCAVEGVLCDDKHRIFERE